MGDTVPDWRIKAVTQRALHRLPGGGRANYLLQRYVTRSAVLRPEFARRKLEQCGRHWTHWEQGGHDRPPDRVIEVGTGWFPFVIVGLALTGCEEVVTVDRSPLLRPENITATLRVISGGLDEGWLDDVLKVVVTPQRGALLRELAKREAVTADDLAQLGIRVIVGDAAALPFGRQSVDLFVSNNTLEHIPEPTLRAILHEFRRVSSAAGTMSHFIDMSDHYSHFDRSISPLNFLRFDDRAWRWWDNGIVPQNRLRLSDYRRLELMTGWRIVYEEVTVADQRQLDVVPLADQFRGRDPEDLRTTHAWLVSEPAQPATSAT